MATEVTAWGKWDCTRCGQKDISGKEKRCPSCGDPREQHELDAMRPPDEAEFVSAAISEPEELALAKDGPDWSCSYCGTNNRASSPICESCGADRAGKRPPAEKQAAPQKKRTSALRWVLGALGVLVLLIAWCTIDHDEDGQVVALKWEHTTTLQRWQDVSRGDWKADLRERAGAPPRAGKGEVAGVSIVGCRPKHHHDEQYACGTENYTTTESYSCGTTQSCSNVSNGNGSYTRTCTSVPKSCTRSVTKSRTKYCTQPVFHDWCDYVTQDWVDVRSEVVRGDGHEGLRFAEIAPSGDLERAAQRGEYTVSFSYGEDGEVYTKTMARGDYDSWRYGDRVLVSVDRMNGATGVRRREAE